MGLMAKISCISGWGPALGSSLTNNSSDLVMDEITTDGCTGNKSKEDMETRMVMRKNVEW